MADDSVPLRDFVDARFQSMDRLLQERYETQTKALDAAFSAAEQAVDKALLAAEKAVTKAEIAAEKRFDAVNEFRGQLVDQAATFLPREVYEAQHEQLRNITDTNTARLNTLLGSTAQAASGKDRSATWTIAMIGFALVIVSIVVSILIVVLG